MNTNMITFEQLPSAVAHLLEKVTNLEKVLCRQSKESVTVPERLDLNGALSYLNELGYKISKSKLQKETANGTIPCRRFNKRLIFEPKELRTWAESRTKKCHDQSAITIALVRSANRNRKY